MGFKNILEMFQLHDEDYEDDYEDDYEESRKLTKSSSESTKNDVDDDLEVLEQRSYTNVKRDEFEQRKVRPVKMDKAVSNKVVPIKSAARNLEVCIMKPSTFLDSQDICDMLLSGRAVVVNLEGFDPIEAQRIMDFISGCVYAINGRLHQISRYIFIFSPENIDISGDYLELLPTEGFGVPTINKEF